MVALLAASSCANVTINASRSADHGATIEPVTFVLYQDNVPDYLPKIMTFYLSRETQRRQIPAQFTTIAGVELDEDAVIKNALKGANGLVTVHRVHPGIYEVQASHLPEKGSSSSVRETRPIWRGRVEIHGGAAAAKMHGFASTLVRRLITDQILPGSPEELPREPLPPGLQQYDR
ncbi:MAG TPA: hypothetical protein VMU50_09325 [Polyangia bacterium]|nr:hypothetical protein [Polyangia bacterium]